MTVTVNGKIRALNREMSIAELLQELSLPPEGIAVAVNASVIPRKNHPASMLNDGDVVEIKGCGGGIKRIMNYEL